MIASIMLAIAGPFASGGINWALARARLGDPLRYGVLIGTLTASGNVVVFTSTLSWPAAVVSLVLSVAGWWLWWWLGRRRDRAPRQLGAKSRLLLEALAERMRESVVPGPGLRPVPGGAR